MKNKITFAEFIEISNKLEITYGTIIHAEAVPKSKLLKLTVDFGNGDVRTVATNISHLVTSPMVLIERRFPFITNLEPSLMKGVNSEAMIFLPKIGEDGILPLAANDDIPNGATLI